MTSTHEPAASARQRLKNLPITGLKDPRRILAAMLDNLKPPGVSEIIDQINQCPDDNALQGLASSYVTSVFTPCKGPHAPQAAESTTHSVTQCRSQSYRGQNTRTNSVTFGLCRRRGR